jgi:hypothetical protein
LFAKKPAFCGFFVACEKPTSMQAVKMATLGFGFASAQPTVTLLP